MKLIMAAAFAALIIASLSAGVYAADVCYPNPTHPGTCSACPDTAYDRSPVPVQIDRPGAGPCYVLVDPWSTCGTFCEAGQIPSGWPYGWRSEYWLRPDSNF